MSLPYEQIRFCPRCGLGTDAVPREPVFRCSACELVLFFNPAVAAGAFLIRADRSLLFLERAKDPARGKLALPGGFIDYGETAEAGLQREIQEEIGLEITGLHFLCSEVNRYGYREITYPVVDLFFTGGIPSGAEPQALDGVAGLRWLRAEEVRADDLAFPSIRAALERLKQVVSAEEQSSMRPE